MISRCSSCPAFGGPASICLIDACLDRWRSSAVLLLLLLVGAVVVLPCFACRFAHGHVFFLVLPVLCYHTIDGTACLDWQCAVGTVVYASTHPRRGGTSRDTSLRSKIEHVQDWSKDPKPTTIEEVPSDGALSVGFQDSKYDSVPWSDNEIGSLLQRRDQVWQLCRRDNYWESRSGFWLELIKTNTCQTQNLSEPWTDMNRQDAIVERSQLKLLSLGPLFWIFPMRRLKRVATSC